jgi:hypothetical protein
MLTGSTHFVVKTPIRPAMQAWNNTANRSKAWGGAAWAKILRAQTPRRGIGSAAVRERPAQQQTLCFRPWIPTTMESSQLQKWKTRCRRSPNSMKTKTENCPLKKRARPAGADIRMVEVVPVEDEARATPRAERQGWRAIRQGNNLLRVEVVAAEWEGAPECSREAEVVEVARCLKEMNQQTKI